MSSQCHDAYLCSLFCRVFGLCVCHFVYYISFVRLNLSFATIVILRLISFLLLVCSKRNVNTATCDSRLCLTSSHFIVCQMPTICCCMERCGTAKTACTTVRDVSLVISAYSRWCCQFACTSAC